MLCTIRVTPLICRPHTRYPTTRRHKRPSPRQQGLAAPAAPPCWPAGHPAQPPSPPEAAAPAKQRAPAQCSEPVPAGRRRLRPGAQPACQLQPGAPRPAAAARCGRKSKGRRRKCRLEKACLGQAQTGPSCASGMHMPRQVGADSGPPAAAKHSDREAQHSQVSPLSCRPHLSHSRRCQPSRSPVSAAAISAAARSRACVASCKQSGTTAGRSISAVFGRPPCSWWSSSSATNPQVVNQLRQWRAALPQPGGAA